jgi:hypothetical protein
MPEIFAQVARLVNEQHPGTMYVGIVKTQHRNVRFGLVLEFRTYDRKPLYGWRDDVSDTVVISEALPP